MKSNKRRAFSVLEVVFACALMSVLIVVLGETMLQSQSVFRVTSGNNDTSALLRKVTQQLQRDLLQTNLKECAVTNTPSNEGGAIWFLSNLEPGTREPRYKADGSPFWCRNILYYLVIPNGHLGLYGRTCPTAAGPSGHDEHCPHKFLIRKEIDTGAATNFADDNTVETLIPVGSISTYLTKPTGYNVAPMYSEAGVQQVKIVGQLLLDFEANLGSGAVNTDVRAVALTRAERETNTSGAMYNSKYTFNFAQSTYPQSR